MINAKDIRIILGIIGNVLSTLISLSHMPRFIQIYKKKSVEGYQSIHHLVMLIVCSLWVLYGLPVIQKDSILVSTSNGIGLMIEAIYLAVFKIYCDDGSPACANDLFRGNLSFCLVYEAAFMSVFYIITILGIGSLSAKLILIGVLCNVCYIGSYVIHANDKMENSKTLKYMPVWLSLVSFINAGIWIAYSLIYKIDIFVLIRSGFEVLSSAFQLIVHACF